ncbi:hypothetical protein CC2G_014577 [Coprinopsis cinerea AmutBmut pab1-1]|nr:hypothetical protein CC2G_014577 [Coprinopsis cinerea AmutBmut pab1-1]
MKSSPLCPPMSEYASHVSNGRVSAPPHEQNLCLPLQRYIDVVPSTERAHPQINRKILIVPGVDNERDHVLPSVDKASLSSIGTLRIAPLNASRPKYNASRART